MEIVIVPISEEHLEGFHECVDVVARERRYLAFLQAPPLESTREFVRSTIANGYVQLVAIAGERLVGWCDILPRQAAGFSHCGVLGMGVHPEYRGQGLGRRLLNEALRRARQQRIEKVELEVYLSNEPALALYRRLGFIVEGVRRKARKLDGEYDDIVLMALHLDD